MKKSMLFWALGMGALQLLAFYLVIEGMVMTNPGIGRASVLVVFILSLIFMMYLSGKLSHIVHDSFQHYVEHFLFEFPWGIFAFFFLWMGEQYALAWAVMVFWAFLEVLLFFRIKGRESARNLAQSEFV